MRKEVREKKESMINVSYIRHKLLKTLIIYTLIKCTKTLLCVPKTLLKGIKLQ